MYFLEENKIDIFDKLVIHHNKKFMDQIKSINFLKNNKFKLIESQRNIISSGCS